MRRLVPSLIGVAVVATWAFWPQTTAGHETLTTTVNFNREIVRILNRRCVMCHSEGRTSFPLETYEQTWLQRRTVRLQALARHMPPWAAAPGYGDFINENRLTLRETQFLVSWVEGMGPRSSGTVFLNIVDASAPPPPEVRAHARAGDWTLGTPGMVGQRPPQTIDVGEGNLVSRAAIDVGGQTSRRLKGLEYRPGDYRVVRAAFFFLEKTGQWLGSWTPWYGSIELPRAAVYLIPPGSRIVAEVHSRGTTEKVTEQGTLALFFTDDDPPRTPTDLVLEAESARRAGTSTTVVRAETRLGADTHVLALRPEFQPGVRSIEVAGRTPDGGTEVLLLLNGPSMDWPTPYIFKDPRFLPRGTQLSVTAHYGNDATASENATIRLTLSRY